MNKLINTDVLVEFYYQRSKEWCDEYNYYDIKEHKLSQKALLLKNKINERCINSDGLLDVFSELIDEDISNFKAPDFAHVFIKFSDNSQGFQETMDRSFLNEHGYYIKHLDPMSKEDIRFMISGLEITYTSYISTMDYVSSKCKKILGE